MIAQAYLNEWASQAPWPQQAQVEQDLVLSRLIVEIARHDLLGGELTFRGGTCLALVIGHADKWLHRPTSAGCCSPAPNPSVLWLFAEGTIGHADSIDLQPVAFAIVI